ncbi:histone deacetylase 6 isoform X1 [Sitophilus oryzae]|uniref:Histone deacetylase 6 isoform X1 n=2 Tax=Sitophilus oryzae TaxID=7048 RepID=A0A6J2XWV7_SITOR|nr:histone deacetylase 6 isoform X1 [Sitophilus oryzae]XP_030756004.1 histone deacetylase 6 isoform X1 [Sitophilus oryzae]
MDSNKGAIPKKSLKDLIKEKRRAKMTEVVLDNPEIRSVVEDPYKPTYDYKASERLATAYGYVPSQRHYSPWDKDFPECPSRALNINRAIQPLIDRLDLLRYNDMVETDVSDLLSFVHPPDAVDKIKELFASESEDEATKYDSIYFNGMHSFQGAIDAVKAAVSLTRLIVEDKVQNGFANIRPPGHHALPCVPNGYCTFNNVAIVAKYLLKNNLAEKILIVDYDVHHGQGTQEIFYNSDKVLYFSIHRYEHGTFWPNLVESNFDHIGQEEGKGYNINVPLNETRLNDHDYLAIIINILLPIAYEFNPSIILVSAGYDACIGCPEGRMCVTPAFYGHLITLLSGLANGKIAVFLEGGYCLSSLADSALRTVRALLGDPCHPLQYTTHINPSVIDSINNTKIALRPYWNCLQMEPLVEIKDIQNYDRFNYHVAVRHFIGEPERPPFPTRGFYPLNSLGEEALIKNYITFLQTERYNLSETVIGYMVNEEAFLHDPPSNQTTQEVQDRIDVIIDKLTDFNLIGQMTNLNVPIRPERPISWSLIDQYIKSTHGEQYLKNIDNDALPKKPDVYLCSSTREVCRWSVAVLAWIGMKIKDKEISHGVGIVRPPGHHAKKSSAGGFCLINNVVVAADYLINQSGYKKILIVDFDVHHGDGTQQLTYNRRDIMYISMHRFDNAKFFPKDKSGNFTYLGSGPGLGFNINIPFSSGKMGNADYLYTWMKIVLPVSYSYNPDIIIVSAGFDAGINDPLGNYSVAPETFGHMINLLKSVAPMVLALEGGYNLETTSLGVVNCVRALLGHPLPMPVLSKVTDEAKATMQNVINIAKYHWPILQVNKSCDPVIRDEHKSEYIEEETQ